MTTCLPAAVQAEKASTEAARRSNHLFRCRISGHKDNKIKRAFDRVRKNFGKALADSQNISIFASAFDNESTKVW